MIDKNLEKYAAVYRSDAQPDGNPLIEALPEQLDVQQLYDELVVLDVLPKNYRSLPVARRVALTEKLRSVYVPLDFAATVYALLCRGFRSAYTGKTVLSITKRLSAIGTAIEYRKYSLIPEAEHQADSFSLLGFSGMGKTYTLNKLLAMFPQVIKHKKYFDNEFDQIQIPYIRIQCPPNDSPKGACIQILNAVDALLGSNLSAEEERSHSNTDMLISRIAQVCTRFCIGAIVIDEIQNIVSMRSKIPANESLFVRFLVELSNKTGVCLICVGTPNVGGYFEAVPHLARRTRGPRIMPLENNEVFYKILYALWSQLPLLELPPLNEEIRETVYTISNGVIETMAGLLISTAQYAFAYKKESIDAKMLREVAKMEGLYVDKRKAPARKKEAEILYEAPKTIEKARKEVKRIVRSEEVKRGRPKAPREQNDIIAAYEACKAEGASLVQRLVTLGVAEVLE